MWGRLAQHRGSSSASAAAGNHRGSIFRLLAGLAIAGRDPHLAVSSWAHGASASPETIQHERELEARVSAVLGEMQVLWLAIEDDPNPESLRGFVERNSIALLSGYRSAMIDPPSPNWLGHHCPRERVKRSGLWNSNHVDERVDPTFLDVFEQLIETGMPTPAHVAGHPRAPVADSDVRIGGHAGLIIAALQRWPDLDDDELSRQSGVAPRQQVNIICRRLERRGILERGPGSFGKIVNRLAGARRAEQPPPEAQVPPPATRPIATNGIASTLPTGLTVFLDPGATDTLVIIPCSGRKTEGSGPLSGSRTLLDDLPEILVRRLSSARSAIADVSHLDESTLMPAWRRNAGTLYQSAHLGLAGAQDASWFPRLLILSGAYGVVQATDAIGTYNLPLNEGRWPAGLLQEVIAAYASRHQIRRVIALASETTGYASILRKVDWRGAGVTDALLLSPETSKGAMVKAPRAIGEALSVMTGGGLDPSWRSSDGLRILVHRMI